MMHIPTSSLYSEPYLLRLGVATQSTLGILETEFWNKGAFLETDITRDFRLGISAIQSGSNNNEAELALHIQNRLLTYGETAVGIGVNDITFTAGSSDSSNIEERVRNLSYYVLLARENNFSDYSLKTYLGVGSGRYGSNFGKFDLDTTTTPGDTLKVAKANSMGFFLGLLLNTSILADRGGLDFMMEFDGNGINTGIKIPITQEYKITIGLSNIQNLPYIGENRENPPGVGFGLDYYLPRVKSSASKQRGGIKVAGVVTEDGVPTRTVIDSSWHKAQESQLLLLRDSLRMTATEIEHLNRMVDQLEQRNQVLEDSVASLQLARHVSDAQINQALKHLSRSLRLFYNEEYEDALIEINEALEFNPNLALAYARRGSIYYKLNQIDRATINWNIALQIDPGYDEVRNILRALNENRLRSAVSIKE
jgi:tetratricopeptide (TPR) repeat protein